MSSPIRSALASIGLPSGDLGSLPDSQKRFPDGAQYRVEIPSVEGRACFSAVLEEADRLHVRVHRVSQGSGVFLLTDDELAAMARLGAEAQVEVSLFTRPNAGWGPSAMAASRAGAIVAATAHGQEQVVACLEDALRAAEHGFQSVLIADLGVLAGFAELRRMGALPADMQAKVSVMLPITNPSAARVIEQLGANTLNVATDLTLGQLAAIRAAVDIPLDVYIESPDNIGGFMRHHEIPESVPHRNWNGGSEPTMHLGHQFTLAELRPTFCAVDRLSFVLNAQDGILESTGGAPRALFRYLVAGILVTRR